MSWIQQQFGLDWFDLGLHVLVTGLIMGVVSETPAPDSVMIVVAAVSAILLGVRRRLALRHRPPPGLTTGEMAAERIDELEHRLTELERAQQRILELEERVDFAERMLVQRDDARLSGTGASRDVSR